MFPDAILQLNFNSVRFRYDFHLIQLTRTLRHIIEFNYRDVILDNLGCMVTANIRVSDPTATVPESSSLANSCSLRELSLNKANTHTETAIFRQYLDLALEMLRVSQTWYIQDRQREILIATLVRLVPSTASLEHGKIITCEHIVYVM